MRRLMAAAMRLRLEKWVGGIGGEGTERRRRLMAVTAQLAGEEGDDGGEARVREMGSGGRG